MAQRLTLHPDRSLPAEPRVRDIARGHYAAVRELPIVSPRGHTDPRWFAANAPFGNAAELLLVPDQSVFRMLCWQGVPMAALGAGRAR